jgi:hypothetical protein
MAQGCFASAVKSGGTTRRAARMATLDATWRRTAGPQLGFTVGRFDPAVRDSMYRSIAASAFRSNPSAVLVGHFRLWPLFMYNPLGDLSRAGGPAPVRSLVRTASWALQFALAAGALLSVLLPAARKRAGDLIVFALMTFLVTGVVTGPLAGTRYSLPFYWVLVSVACCGWLSIFGRGGGEILEDRHR